VRRDDGSAVVGFVAVVPLLVVVVLAVVQVALALHVRATVASAAADGARAAALADGDPQVARARLESALSTTLADGVVEDVAVTRTAAAGLDVVEVEVRARLPLVGLLGPATMVVHGHALAEP
jgi:Flp pilus assembly protein TadG